MGSATLGLTQRRASVRRRRLMAGAVVVLAVAGSFLFFRRDNAPPKPWQIEGSVTWAAKYYGNANHPKFRDRNIIEIDFLGEIMYVHEKVAPHFLRLGQIFQAEAPAYAAEIDISPDDWSYNNRKIRGGDSKSMHSWGIAIDVNALTNVLGTEGDMPQAVVDAWEAEGGEWGGDWTRPDPMHFESHLTPAQIRHRYRPDGSPRDWYLEELTGG